MSCSIIKTIILVLTFFTSSHNLEKYFTNLKQHLRYTERKIFITKCVIMNENLFSTQSKN